MSVQEQLVLLVLGAVAGGYLVLLAQMLAALTLDHLVARRTRTAAQD